MFSTEKRFEVAGFLEDDTLGTKYWTAIQCRFNRPCFLLEVKGGVANANEQKCYLLPSSEELNIFLRAMPSETSVVNLHLISPPAVNESETWQMHSLSKAVLLLSTDSCAKFEFFQPSNGEAAMGYPDEFPEQPAFWQTIYRRQK